MTRYRAKYPRFLPFFVVILVLCSLVTAGQKAVYAAQTSAIAANNTLTPEEVKEGWTLLFDGSTLTGWKPTGTAQWGVDDGSISVTIDPAHLGDLFTTAPFSDFEIKVDFWTEKRTSNSGIFLRCTPIAGKLKWYEVNISDATHHGWPTGSIVDVQSTAPAETWGKWNTLDILADGSHMVVKLNGRTTVDAHDTKLSSGLLGLEGAGSGPLRFRNIKIRTINRSQTSSAN